MSSVIRVLDEQTINQIAAGEVIENPASVVKELVENAIDAGSTEICVEIKGGGRQLIRITDNGSGMTHDDALLSLERHATSKIREVEDIHEISTMGFRGEAVPSIASISKFSILTRSQQEEEGTVVIVDGGKTVSCAAAARSPGTTIEVKQLFFNTPVRKKFQRSPTYDANEILKRISIQALAHPEVKFELINNQATALSTQTPEGEIFIEQIGERVSDVLGDDFFAALCPVDIVEGDIHLQGYVGLPTYNRHNRTGQYLFINRRAVFSPLVSFAVKEGYGTALSTTRHPVYVLHLTMPGGLVDVNVHPQKREVRLRQSQELKELIIRGVTRALQGSGITPIEEIFEPIELPSAPAPRPTFTLPPPTEPIDYASYRPPEPLYVSEPTSVALQQDLLIEEKIITIPTILTTIKGYILVDEDEGITFIDQRAAHARTIFEKLQKRSQAQKGIEVQTLLIPHMLETTAPDAAMVREMLPQLNQMGIHIADFGPTTFTINAIPQIFGNSDVESLVQEIVDVIHRYSGDNAVQKELAKHIARAASHAAMSRNQRLSGEEAERLLGQLVRCDQPWQCPQGKPVRAMLTRDNLVKLFK